MNTFTTSQAARMIGVHPNTVRLYEELGLIPAPRRKPNGYREFTDFHIWQLRLARKALQVEVLQNGLRKRAVEIVKTSARGEIAEARRLADLYLQELREEQRNAEEAIHSVRQILSGRSGSGEAAGGPEQEQGEGLQLRRKETAHMLHISMDTLRNWEMNGLLAVKRRENGYRVYTADDLERLKIIRALRCANYSLSAILRLLGALSRDPDTDIRAVIDTPGEDDDIISVCDKLLTSLCSAERNALELKEALTHRNFPG